jgi:signal transduction histidine kinase
VRCDPGAVLLALRQAPAVRTLPGLSFFPALLREPAVLEGAARLLEAAGHGAGASGSGFVDWNQPSIRPIYLFCLAIARLAHHLAEHTGRCDPDNAWVAGLLAPLGWLAVCAVGPEQAAACLEDSNLANSSVDCQTRAWGLDAGGIARRLGRRWGLPRWLTVVSGHLDLPAEDAQMLGAEPDLFRVVQLAVDLVQRHGPTLHMRLGASSSANALALGLSQGEREGLEPTVASCLETPAPATWAAPFDEPLLKDCLLLAAENRRLAEAVSPDAMESDVDQLHRALQEQHDGEKLRLQALKLQAMAELAAGAGHEINNPLAVISGQAQYLLNHEAEPAGQKALQTIIAQTQRIHVVLKEMMQFARPPRPQKQLLDAAGLIQEAVTDLNDLAAQRHVQVLVGQGLGATDEGREARDSEPSPLTPRSSHLLYADPRQLRTALACLVRNAIEAAPAEGWASVRLETPAPDRIEFVVEDNGPGLSPALREHLFDPFYSGRPAGRGRGLGLPTAWRLAREHGGDVRFEDLPQGPTRFVLSLPREEGVRGREPGVRDGEETSAA